MGDTRDNCVQAMQAYLNLVTESEQKFQQEMQKWNEELEHIKNLPDRHHVPITMCSDNIAFRDNQFANFCRGFVAPNNPAARAGDYEFVPGSQNWEYCWGFHVRGICSLRPNAKSEKLNAHNARKPTRLNIPINNLSCQTCIQEANNNLNLTGNADARQIAQSNLQNCISNRFPEQPTISPPLTDETSSQNRPRVVPNELTRLQNVPGFDFNAFIDIRNAGNLAMQQCSAECEKDSNCVGVVTHHGNCWLKRDVIRNFTPFHAEADAWVKTTTIPEGGLGIVFSIHGPENRIVIESGGQLVIGEPSQLAADGMFVYEPFTQRIISQKDNTKCLTVVNANSVVFRTMSNAPEIDRNQRWQYMVASQQWVCQQQWLNAPKDWQIGQRVNVTNSPAGTTQFVNRTHTNTAPQQLPSSFRLTRSDPGNEANVQGERVPNNGTGAVSDSGNRSGTATGAGTGSNTFAPQEFGQQEALVGGAASMSLSLISCIVLLISLCAMVILTMNKN